MHYTCPAFLHYPWYNLSFHCSCPDFLVLCATRVDLRILKFFTCTDALPLFRYSPDPLLLAPGTSILHMPVATLVCTALATPWMLYSQTNTIRGCALWSLVAMAIISRSPLHVADLVHPGSSQLPQYSGWCLHIL